MNNADYKALAEREFLELGHLVQQREDLELSISKKIQFIRAIVNMLPDDERVSFDQRIEIIGAEREGLTDAVKGALQATPGQWHTATQVRDKLKGSNFDFSRYTANPLASIHAVLKRLKPPDFENTNLDGVMAWRFGKPASKRNYGAKNSLANMLLRKKPMP
jgi:hypothetical protein